MSCSARVCGGSLQMKDQWHQVSGGKWAENKRKKIFKESQYLSTLQNQASGVLTNVKNNNKKEGGCNMFKTIPPSAD